MAGSSRPTHAPVPNLKRCKMRVQSSHAHDDRGLDPYFTPPEATQSLLEIEKDQIPRTGVIWEPAAGNGAISSVLSHAGYTVFASDIADYGAGFELRDYLAAAPPLVARAIITNPPFKLAEAFVHKAECPDGVNRRPPMSANFTKDARFFNVSAGTGLRTRGSARVLGGGCDGFVISRSEVRILSPAPNKSMRWAFDRTFGIVPR